MKIKEKNVLPDYENGNLTPYKGLKRVGSSSCCCNAFPSCLVCLSQTCKSFYGSKILKSGHINFMAVSKFGDKTRSYMLREHFITHNDVSMLKGSSTY